jgi:hypothetical protein
VGESLKGGKWTMTGRLPDVVGEGMMERERQPLRRLVGLSHIQSTVDMVRLLAAESSGGEAGRRFLGMDRLRESG